MYEIMLGLIISWKSTSISCLLLNAKEAIPYVVFGIIFILISVVPDSRGFMYVIILGLNLSFTLTTTIPKD